MKKLYRGRDVLIGGVCSGISEWLGWNVDGIRFLWVILLISDMSVFVNDTYNITISNIAFFVYIILWILLKEKD